MLGTGRDTSQVVPLADSWWALSSIHPMLEEHTGTQCLRTHYLSGVSMTFPNAFGPPIPTQYDAAKAERPIKTVIMDGGGNDVLLHPNGALGLSPCHGAISAECMRAIDDVVNTYDALIKRMRADGVQDIVVFYYGYLPDPGYDAVMDLGAELGRVSTVVCGPALQWCAGSSSPSRACTPARIADVRAARGQGWRRTHGRWSTGGSSG